jgi:formylglycine-generating enzyme required for sulfatase activity
VTSVAPNAGPVAGGATVTISGRNLTGATGVLIGGSPASGVVVTSPTTITAVTPPGTAGGKPVVVVSPWGQGTLANAYTYFPQPMIASVGPTAGPIAGGTAITITGTDFTGTTAVTIGGVPAANFTVVSPTAVTAVTPANSAGAKIVSLTTPGGMASLASGFTYYAVPTISSVSPNAGPIAGGTAITITGTNLTGLTSLTIGGTAASTVTVVSATTVTAVTPASTVGAKAVSLSTPGGVASLANGFTYFAQPTISSVSPNAGPISGGTAITITGSNLTGTSLVMIGGAAATSVSVVNATTVTAVTSAGTAGASTVSLTTPGGTANLTNGFTYTSVWYTVLEQNPDPAIVTSATLRNAITATGYPWRVRDNGTNIEMVLIPPGTFSMGCSVSNQYACASDGRESPVHAVTLTGAFYMGRYEVTQAQWIARMGSNPSYWVARAENGNTANTNRPVETVSWNQIAGAGGFLSGTGLRLPTEAEWEYACRAGTTTAFHGFTGYLAGTNDDTLVGNIAWFSGNNGASGTPTYGTKAVGQKLANGFGLFDMSGNVREWVNDWYSSSYYASSPSSNPTGPATGSYRMLRGGSWLNPTNDVRSSYRIYNTPDITFNSYGFRVARAPTGTEAPAITSVLPASGSTDGGTLITITGTNLTGTSSVTIGGAAATSVSVVNATTVTAVTPAGTAGAKTVSLTTPGGTANLTNGFTYTTVWYTVLEQNPDPAIVTSATLRNAITATGYPWRVRDNGTNIEMVLIPPGTFNMGCTASNQYGCGTDESPVHSVTLTGAFYMGQYEVTQAQWQARMGSNPSYFVARPENGNTANTNRPVEQVSWNQIAGTGGFLSGTGLRLPTEAEWEYACRAGTTTAFHGFTGFLTGTNDDTLAGNIAWFSGNNGASGTPTYGTKAVGQKLANGFGLFDMSGNVWEWVNDWYSSSYYASSPLWNPTGPTAGTSRVRRGGSWGGITGYVRSSYRGSNTSDYTTSFIGFRVARTP